VLVGDRESLAAGTVTMRELAARENREGLTVEQAVALAVSGR
jgi:hypothetical protein